MDIFLSWVRGFDLSGVFLIIKLAVAGPGIKGRRESNFAVSAVPGYLPGKSGDFGERINPSIP
jgi:hypothetical protein